MRYVMVLSKVAERYDMLRLVGSLLCWRLFAESRKGEGADAMALWPRVCSALDDDVEFVTPNSDEAETQMTLAQGVRDLCETGEDLDEYLEELQGSWEELKREAAEVCGVPALCPPEEAQTQLLQAARAPLLKPSRTVP